MAKKQVPHKVSAATIDANTQSPERRVFASTLNSLLADRKIHQEDMARDLGISVGSVSSYRNGLKEPRLSMILKIANYLGVDCHYLLTGVRAEHYTTVPEIGLSSEAIDKILRCNHMSDLNDIVKTGFLNQFADAVYEFNRFLSDNIQGEDGLRIIDVRNNKIDRNDALNKNLDRYGIEMMQLGYSLSRWVEFSYLVRLKGEVNAAKRTPDNKEVPDGND